MIVPISESDPFSGDRIVLAGLKRLLSQNLVANDDSQSAWISFCVSLCSGYPKKPIYEPAVMIDEFLLPLLPAYPLIVISCFEAMFANNKVKIHFRQPIQRPKKEQVELEAEVEKTVVANGTGKSFLD